MTYEEAVREVYFWQYSNSGCFHNQFFDLFCKADHINRAKLSLGFPEEASAFAAWNLAADFGDELFREHGLMKDERKKNERTEADGEEVPS